MTFLIPILTPGFFKSQACRDELEWFLEHERELGRNDLILPLHYVNCPLISDKARHGEDKLAELLRTRQIADWRQLRFKPLADEGPSRTISKLAEQIVAVLRLTASTDASQTAEAKSQQSLSEPKMINIPDQSLAPVLVELRAGRIAQQHPPDHPLLSAESEFDRWRMVVLNQIKEELAHEFRPGTNHERLRRRLGALADSLEGTISDVLDREFTIGNEIERFDGLVNIYLVPNNDMPLLSAAVLAEIDHLRNSLKNGRSKLVRWMRFQVDAAGEPNAEKKETSSVVADALSEMAGIMDDQPQYFNPELPRSFRFLAATAKDPTVASKIILYGAVRSADNLMVFLGQRALGIGKTALDAVEGQITRAIAVALIAGSLGAAASSISETLPHALQWLKPVLTSLGKLSTPPPP